MSSLDQEAGNHPEFVAQKGSLLKWGYQKLSEIEKKNLTKEIETVWEQHVKISWANPKAIQHDINAPLSNMEDEVSYFLAWNLASSNAELAAYSGPPLCLVLGLKVFMLL